MALTTPLKSQRKSRSTPPQTPTHQFLQFEIAQQHFALPISQVLKIIPLTTIYGDPSGRGIGLAHYQKQEIIVINIEKILLPYNPLIPKITYQFLLILQTDDLNHPELLGIPILAPPRLTRIDPKAITPLPAHYRTWGNIQSVSSLIIDTQTHNPQPLFIIDAQQVLSQFSQP